jgi:hypothetical protein
MDCLPTRKFRCSTSGCTNEAAWDIVPNDDRPHFYSCQDCLGTLVPNGRSTLFWIGDDDELDDEEEV